MAKKIFLLVFILSSFSFGKLIHITANKEFLKKDIKIIDIRTKGEWKETGVVVGAYLIEFFDERGNYDTELFLKKLNTVVKKNEQFAIICRTGSRTHMVGDYLGNKLKYNVINLSGGVQNLFYDGYEFQKYKK